MKIIYQLRLNISSMKSSQALMWL